MRSFDELLLQLDSLNHILHNISVPISDALLRLQHAESVLEKDYAKHFSNAARHVAENVKMEIQQYLGHIEGSVSITGQIASSVIFLLLLEQEKKRKRQRFVIRF